MTASPCTFATLNQTDYSAVLGELHKRKIREKVAFFKEFRIFNGLSKYVIEKIILFMEKKIFKHGQYVYQENVSPCDRIYFVSDGLFEVLHKVEKKEDKRKAEKITLMQRRIKQLKKIINRKIRLKIKMIKTIKKTKKNEKERRL